MDIIIKNFPPIISSYEIKRLFRKYGSVGEVRKEKMENTALVRMPHEYQAKKAINELNGSEFFGKRIKVEEKT